MVKSILPIGVLLKKKKIDLTNRCFEKIDDRCRDGAKRCKNCGYSIISQTHQESCITVPMWGKETQMVSGKFKPMMTYGLSGCTAIIIVRWTNEQMIDITMAHNPSAHVIKQIFQQKHNFQQKFQVVIKTPEKFYETEPGSKKWKTESEDQSFWESTVGSYENVDMTLDLYSKMSMSGDGYNSTLYVKKVNGKLVYTDSYGRYIPFTLKKQ